MKHHTRFALILSAALLPGMARAADGPFLSIPFTEAVKRAEAEKKLLFLDFYTTWCPPCKLMDRTTWKDSKVIEFLKSKVVALAIDAEKDAALAERFRVMGYPTLIFAKPDGSVVEMAVNYLDAQQFLTMSELVLSGKDSMSRLAEALKKTPDHPVALVQMAEALAMRGKHQEALEHLTRVLESPQPTPLTLTVIPVAAYSTLALSGGDPEAEKMIERRQEAASKAIDQQTATDTQLALFAAVNMINREPGKTLARYDRLRESKADEKFIERATRAWKSNLIEEKRFDDVAARFNVVAEVKQLLSGLPSSADGAPPAEAPAGDIESLARRQLMMQVLDYYTALVALGRGDEAGEVAKEALRVDGSAGMYEALAWTGFATGKPLDANLEQARKAHELSGGKDPSVIDTLARILHARGQKDEAVKLVRSALEWAEPGMGREDLARTLHDLEAQKGSGALPEYFHNPANRLPQQED